MIQLRWSNFSIRENKKKIKTKIKDVLRKVQNCWMILCYYNRRQNCRMIQNVATFLPHFHCSKPESTFFSLEKMNQKAAIFFSFPTLKTGCVEIAVSLPTFLWVKSNKYLRYSKRFRLNMLVHIVSSPLPCDIQRDL